MPVLIVYGMPNVDQPLLTELIDNLQRSVALTSELNLTPDKVSVFFPADRIEGGLGEELVCFIQCLLATPEQIPRVRHRVCNTLVQFARMYLPQCRLVEVAMEEMTVKFERGEVASTWRKEEKE